ncbi:TMAO reductase system protein TorT [Microvirga antarctica]|uniref:TMAO reductase system protein TorT n=1 Tax=Microvirga antarctica TaxID=2819233 RepID=UPI001B311EDC|nr:TMAO reductase system protein TorT [Microvirga antarctica]
MTKTTISLIGGLGLLASLTTFSGATLAQEKTIGVAVPNLASSFWISAVYGVEDEAKKNGVKVLKLNAGGDANSSQQIAQIQDLIQRKVDAIVVGATNGDAVKAIVEQAIERGIPVIGVSSPPSSTKLASIVSADHYDMGKLQAECLAKALGGKGNVAMMAGPTGQAWSDLRAKGFKETLAKQAPAIKVVAESRLADNRNAALTTAEDWTQRFPDLNGVYAATDDMAAGVISAYKSAGKLKGVKVSASNLSPTAQQLLKDGELVCTSIQQVVAQGRAALKQAAAAANKQPVQKEVVLPALLVTTDNLASVDMSSVVAPSDYRP